MKHQSVAVSSAAGPSRGQPPTSSHKIGAKNANNGIGGLPGGVVGPEAAGLDPSSPEHFFVTLAAYADALDALPLDLTRSFSDLRELDAVLGSHLNSLTARLNHLTALIEDPDVDQGQRLLALKEVAEEARAYKMGGEDKIRVALNTAETIISHTDYIDALDNQLDRFAEISTLLNPTKHLKLDQYYVPGQLKDRKLITTLDSLTGAASGLAGADANGTGGSKKKKVAANVVAASVAGGKGHKAADTASLAGSNAGGGASSSKKRKAVSGATVGGSSAHTSSKVAKTSASGKGDDDVKTAANGSTSHKKKTDSSSHAAGSGSKSSHAANSNTRLPRAAHAHIGYTEDDEEGPNGRKDGAARRGADADESSAASRSRNSRNARTTAAQRSDDEDEDLDDGDVDEEEDDTTARSSNKNRSRAGRGNTSGNSRAKGAGANSSHTGSNSASRADSPASNAGGAGDDADEARYCFCNNVSYGDMIGCDDDDCEREWFHLGCVGLTKPPQGTWYCEACLERRANNGRGGKGKKGAKSSGGGSKSKVRR